MLEIRFLFTIIDHPENNFMIHRTHRRQWRFILFSGLIFFTIWMTPARADAPSPVDVSALHATAELNGTVRVIVALRPAPTFARRDAIAGAQSSVLSALGADGVSAVRTYRTLPYVALTVSPAALERLARLSQVASISADTLAAMQVIHSTQDIGATSVWQMGYSGAGWSVVVMDTGVDSRHTFLRNKVIAEACFSTTMGTISSSLCANGSDTDIGVGAAQPCSGVAECWHGTHVAGIAAGRGTEFSGVAKDATIIAVQIFSLINDDAICNGVSPCLRSYSSDQLAAFDYINEIKGFYNIAAINLSAASSPTTGTCNGNPLSAVIETLWDADIATVVAAGNEGRSNAVDVPACISHAVSVGATTALGATERLSDFSNRSAQLDLLAPGEGIYSSLPNNRFGTESGTSMATPHVAGAWAVLKSYAATVENETLLETVITSGVPITDTATGRVYARIQLDAAIHSLTADTSPAERSAPQIDAISRQSGVENTETDIVIRGRGFWGTPAVRMGEILLMYVTLVNDSEVRATVPAGLSAGTYALSIANPDGQQTDIPAAFTIETAPHFAIFLPVIFAGNAP